MIDISMSRISPKLIDVDGNRVGDEFIETIRKVEKIHFSSTIKPYYKKNRGRFPTQLFTNIKNDKFKYVKNIT